MPIYEVGYQLVDKKWMVEEIHDIPARHFSNQAYITYWGYQVYVHAEFHIAAMESGIKIINHEIETRKRVDRGQMKFAVVRVTFNEEVTCGAIKVVYIAYSQQEALDFRDCQTDSAQYCISKIPTEEEQNELCKR